MTSVYDYQDFVTMVGESTVQAMMMEPTSSILRMALAVLSWRYMAKMGSDPNSSMSVQCRSDVETRSYSSRHPTPPKNGEDFTSSRRPTTHQSRHKGE